MAGRKVKIYYKTSAAATEALVAGGITRGFTVTAEGIDITDGEDAGDTTLLDDIASKNVALKIEGILKDTTLSRLAHDQTEGSTQHLLVFRAGTLITVSGSFMITNLSIDGEAAGEAAKFSADFTQAAPTTMTT
jgi:predicted secreted protein